MKTIEHPDQAVVLLEEEYGYRNWVWYTGMSDGALIDWWRNLHSVSPYFFTPVGLPGAIKELSDPRNQEEVEQLQRESGVFTYSEKGTNNKRVFLKIDRNCWSGHIHEDEDSFLFHKEHGYIHHKGHTKVMED